MDATMNGGLSGIQILTALANLGGMGMLSAVLFYLHMLNSKHRDKDREFRHLEFKEMLTTFKAEQKFEREQCASHFDTLASAIEKTHEASARQTHILEAQQRLLEEHHRVALGVVAKLNVTSH